MKLRRLWELLLQVRRAPVEGDDLRQPMPEAMAGVGWYVFEHLQDADVSDPGALAAMTRQQQLVYGFNLLRQEVGSGGFVGYFNWTSNTSSSAAHAAALQFSPAMAALLEKALIVVGARGPDAALDNSFSDAPGVEEALAKLSLRFHEEEGAAEMDLAVDSYITRSDLKAFFR